MWARDHEQLLSRKQKKARREAGRGGVTGAADPATDPGVGAPPHLARRRARRVVRPRTDGGEVEDTKLLGEWSPEFNSLVDMYDAKLQEFIQSQADDDYGGGGGGGGGGALDVSTKSASLSRSTSVAAVDMGKRGSLSMQRRSLYRATRAAAQGLSRETRTALGEYVGHGRVYFEQMLNHLRASSADRFSETNAFSSTC